MKKTGRDLEVKRISKDKHSHLLLELVVGINRITKSKKVLFSLLFLISLISMQAQWIQIGADIDGEATNDFSGVSVSMNFDGSIIAVGARNNDGNGVDSGQVRVFKNQGGNWVQMGNDIYGEAAEDRFGQSVSLNDAGDILAVGAILNDGNGVDSGHVRVFQNQSGVWTQIGADIDGEAAGDEFGSSVSLNATGSIVAIGGVFNSENGNSAGHVRVFENQSGAWVQLGLDIDGETVGNYFGGRVSLNDAGDIFVASASRYSTNGNLKGQVRAFTFQAGDWVQLGNALEGEFDGDQLGHSVSLSADGLTLAASSIYNDTNGQDSGQTKVYRYQSGNWQQVGAAINGIEMEEYSGYSVRLNKAGSLLVIGASGNDTNGSNSGQVRVYQNQAGSWSQVGAGINGEALGDYFGTSVGMNAEGNAIIVGAPWNDGNGNTAGQVRVFNNSLLSTSSIQQASINLYPNPFQEKVVLNYEHTFVKELRIFNSAGKVVKTIKEVKPNEPIDLSYLNNGFYLVKFQTDKGVLAKKIIKKK